MKRHSSLDPKFSAQDYKRKPIPKCDFSKVAKQHYRNHTSEWVFYSYVKVCLMCCFDFFLTLYFAMS